ncbi:HEAT repeat domain-containing protein [Streptomyces mutabilis]|uniref:HEAT repeat domain-containing protein n=1 Tax=Streptomyces mutabilis TaxID=67332 RepID=UPI0037A347F7
MTQGDSAESISQSPVTPTSSSHHTQPQVDARGNGAIGAGNNATYNATGKGSSVQDNRTIIILNSRDIEHSTQLDEEEINSSINSYASQIQATYGRLDLEALIPTTEGEHPRMELREVFIAPLLRADPPPIELPVELHRRLIECGELPDAKEEAPQVPGMNEDLWERARQAYRERPAVTLLETLAAADSRNVVLLGDPGSGKSTLSRYLTLSLTSSKSLTGPLQPLAGLLPVIIELRRYAEANWRERSFEDFLAHVYKYEGHAPPPALLGYFLKEGKALVIFDGLDELFDPRVRDDVTRRIKGFTARYPEIRTVVTSRVIGYNRHMLDAAGFRHYMIQSLNDDQITSFTQRWYEAVCPESKQEAERLGNRLSEAINRSRPVRELAGNPLLLTILAIIARRQRLPRDRAGVYQHAVNVLVSHWDEDAKHLDLAPDIRAITDLDDRDRREMLERLARHMQDGEEGIAGNHILGEEVEQVFTEYLLDSLQLDFAPARKVARAMVKQLRERNFILSLYGSQVYGFVHRAFLEYLAASDVVRRYQQRELTDEELLDGVFARHASDPAWHEVLLLIAGMLGDKVAAPAIEKILGLQVADEAQREVPPAVLALRALTEVRRVGALKDQSEETAKALIRYWNKYHVVPASVAADTDVSFNSLGPQWVGGSRIRRWLHASGGAIRSSAVAYSLFTDMDVLLAIASRAWFPAARAGALPYLARKWPAEAKVFTLVREQALDDPHGFVRSDALDVLADQWHHEIGVRDLIQSRATEDDDEYVRRWALATLARHWDTDRSVRELIERQAAEDPHHYVRSSAINVLADHWGEDPAVQKVIQSSATRDQHEYVRSVALITLARHWGGDERSVRELIQQQAIDDPSHYVRSNAIVALADHWDDDPSVRKIIQHRAREDSDEHARSRALDTLADHWGSDPAVRKFIQRRAEEDPHEHVRSDALDTIADHWPDDPSVRQLLEQHAVDDPHEFMRRWATVTLGQHWSDRRSVFELIYELASEDPNEDVRISALETLVEHWSNDPALQKFVEDRSTSDSSLSVRQRALTLLADTWTEKPIIESIVSDLQEQACQADATNDGEFLRQPLVESPHAEVRIEAARILGSLWSAEARTLPLLRQRAESDPSQEVRESMELAVRMAEAYSVIHDRLW